MATTSAKSADSEAVLALYDAGADGMRQTIGRLVAEDEVEAVAAATREAFVALLPELPYREKREHTMFGSAFGVFTGLALYRAVRERGVDAHQVGRAILAGDFPKLPSPMPEPALDMLRRDAEASQKDAAENEFVFAFVEGDSEPDTDWGIDVLQCAVCHAFGNHDAMELVPYMCAVDDGMSDDSGQGLRRTGTIALGAHKCDFRYKHQGTPKRLAEQYPDKIRLEGLEE